MMKCPRCAGYITLFVAALALAAGAAGEGRAHAFLERASPAAGNIVSPSPVEIRLWFSENLELRFSRADLVGVAGEKIASGSVDRKSPSQLVIRVLRLVPGNRKRSGG